MNKNSSWETSVKPVVVLSVIALIVSLLLAMVNSFTAPIIEDNQKAATLAAYVDVMPTVSSASDLEEVTDYTTENITGAVKATDGSLAIKAEEKGFDGGILSVIIGFDTNGTVTASGWTLLPRPRASAATLPPTASLLSSMAWMAPRTSPWARATTHTAAQPFPLRLCLPPSTIASTATTSWHKGGW